MSKGISYRGQAVVYIGLIGALIGPPKVLADDFTFQFNNTFSGTSPTGPAPWVTVEIKDVAANTVDMTFSGSGLQGSEFADELYLNFNPNLDVTQLSINNLSSSGGFALPTSATGANAFMADGDGHYDIEFNFSTANGSRFMAGDSMTYQFTSTGSLNADDFDFTSQMGGGAGQWLAAAHINSIGGSGQSGWDSPTQLTPAPEPGTLALMGMGLAGLVALRRRNRK